MDDWLNELDGKVADEDPRVLVTVAQSRGSAPREAGAKLVVSESGVTGSIGGGNLEFRAIDSARRLLVNPSRTPSKIERVALGPSLGQCCGGDVTLVYEILGSADQKWIRQARLAFEGESSSALVARLAEGAEGRQVVCAGNAPSWIKDRPSVSKSLTEVLLGRSTVSLIKAPESEGGSVLIERLFDDRAEVWVFGAGHVGRALINVLGAMSFRVYWADSRVTEFPELLPSNTQVKVAAAPVNLVDEAASGALFLVMTHSHPLDLAICEAVLKRRDFRYLGLIGSATKKSQFLRQLREGGIPEADLERLTCPIGLPGIKGKKPGEIAVAVAAQLLQVAHQ